MAYADRSQSGSRVVAIVIVALIHAVIGYAFVTGLAYQYVKKVQENLSTFEVEEPPPPPEEVPPPPPPDQAVQPPPVVTPPPIVQTNVPPPIQIWPEIMPHCDGAEPTSRAIGGSPWSLGSFSTVSHQSRAGAGPS